MKYDFINNYTLEELQKEFGANKIPKFRAVQMYEWLHDKNITDINEITVFNSKLKKLLEDRYKINQLKIETVLKSNDKHTHKYLFKTYDDEYIETVLMKYKHGYSICVSTQIGCLMGCVFCASGKNGKIRDLLAAEILEQIYEIEKHQNIRISNVVLMGMGEPLDNYNEVMKFIRILNSEMGHNIGMRHITLSTCGIVPMIKKLADEKLQLTLSISLHATNNKKRKEIMPIARKYDLDTLLEVCLYYIEKTNRRITFEYTMIDGINDTEEEAMKLAKLLKGLLCHVNLIPLNDTQTLNYKKTRENQIVKFKDILEKAGIQATVRREMGSDINAACGQLRKKYIEE